MLLEKDRIRLQHMLDAAHSALAFIKGYQREDLDTNAMLTFALVRALEIIGEAAGQMSEATRCALPQIPWGDIVGMRHRLIHAYFDVDLNRVWDTVSHYVPELADQIEAALQQNPPAHAA
jgi:uncharacterized protein with HEPN domain